jgi:integration host factor subunit beta
MYAVKFMINEPAIVPSLTKSDLIRRLSQKQRHLAHNDVDQAINGLIKMMSDALATGERIEVRGFGSFSLRYRRPRAGRNPASGEIVNLSSKYVPHFKPGKELRTRINK